LTGPTGLDSNHIAASIESCPGSLMAAVSGRLRVLGVSLLECGHAIGGECTFPRTIRRAPQPWRSCEP
jgi:hypothetical protein